MPTLWLPQGQKPLPGQIVDWNAMGLPRPVGEWWFNEGSGGLVQDASGNGNHGILTNMDPATDWVPTTRGMGLDFDGTNDGVRPITQIKPSLIVTVHACVKLANA